MKTAIELLDQLMELKLDIISQEYNNGDAISIRTTDNSLMLIRYLNSKTSLYDVEFIVGNIEVLEKLVSTLGK